MKIRSLEPLAISLPMTEPMKMAGVELRAADNVLVRIETERGAVVGTTSVFVDLSFGLSPAFLGAVAGVAGYDGAFLASAAVVGFGALLLAARRQSLARPLTAGAATLDG